MVVDGSHLKQPLAVGQLEVAHLQNHGHGFHDVHEAHHDQNQRHIQRKGQSADHTAQKQGAGIAHEDLGRMPVVAQVSDQTAQQRRRQNCQIPLAQRHSGGGEEHHHRQGHRAGQTVHTVGQVHRIVAAHHDEHGEEDVDHRMHFHGHIHEGDVQRSGHTAGLPQQVQKQGRNCHLQQHFLQRGQTQVALVLHLAEVIGKAHRTEAQAHAQHEEGRIISHKGDVAQQAHDHGGNEHQAAHHGSASLIVVPGGAHLTDGLTGL